MNIKKRSEPTIIKSVSLVFAVLVGLIVGLLIGNIPYLSLDKSVDLGAIVSIIALFVATIVVPFKINSYISKKRNINSIVVADINDLLELLESIRLLFETVANGNKKVTIPNKKLMVSRFTQANNQIIILEEQFKNHLQSINFTEEVAVHFSRNVYPVYTDNFQSEHKIPELAKLPAATEMEKTVSTLKKIRYRIYA